MTKEKNISFTQELIRKGIHLISLSIPVLYIFLDKYNALLILVPLTIIAIIIDILSKHTNIVRFVLLKYFRHILRPHETQDKLIFNGATWVLISATICVIVFPKLLTVVGFTILIISDISAALVGRRFGKHPIFVNKSLEGTLAFIISACIVILSFGIIYSAPWTFFIAGFISAVVGGLAEAISPIIKVDDNLSIPVSVALTLWLLELYAAHIGYPYLNLL